jgi:hypothetical protein
MNLHAIRGRKVVMRSFFFSEGRACRRQAERN